MQERCSAGLGAPTSCVRRDGRRRTQGRVDPGAGAQSGPVPAGSAAVLISGEVAGDSRADDDARPREELISWGWGARSCWLRLPVAYAGVAGVQHHGGSSRARKHTATTTLRPAGAPSSRSMVVVNVVGSNAAAVGSIPYRSTSTANDSAACLGASVTAGGGAAAAASGVGSPESVVRPFSPDTRRSDEGGAQPAAEKALSDVEFSGGVLHHVQLGRWRCGCRTRPWRGAARRLAVQSLFVNVHK
ncbi:uncharacterized protein LOC125506955 isoform X2 [Triticum urartu]|uniref:uncharacterized protein LOC125506955 isoform X2 n=1 Tax=Triticum urartu TaxID=4572 RepID=UPI002043C866|nr:uncharacterized protein LOC125506955 isoform X2 [Triticum urartu]